MRLLLDTHVLLWWLEDSDRIAGEPADLIDRADEVVVSAASVWEVEIKRAKGKLIAPDGLRDQIPVAGFSELAISARHAEEAAHLPPHHQDPFDRILVAQARIEDLILMTADRSVLRYEVPAFPIGEA